MIIALSAFALAALTVIVFLNQRTQSFATTNYENDPSSNRGLYAYDLGGLRLLFAGERTLKEGVGGMSLLHQNEFWDTERCAGMTPSIFNDTAYFVDKRILVAADGSLMKKSFIYKFDLKAGRLSEIVSPLFIERIYKRGDQYAAARLVLGRLMFLYDIDEYASVFRLKKVTIVPEGTVISAKSNFLEWCNETGAQCVRDETYLGYDSVGKKIMQSHDETSHTYEFGAQKLVVPNAHKNIFLGF